MFLLCVETREEPVFEFATPPSSPKAADVEVQKEGRRSPSIEVVTPPSVHVPSVHVDSSNNFRVCNLRSPWCKLLMMRWIRPTI
ncbi:hypothetical protein Hanom_Chr01g00067651 [Helianthus anomalus]